MRETFALYFSLFLAARYIGYNFRRLQFSITTEMFINAQRLVINVFLRHPHNVSIVIIEESYNYRSRTSFMAELFTLFTVTLKSPQIRKPPLVFSMGTMGAAQLLCETGEIIVCLTIFDSSSSTFSFIA